MNKFSRAMHMAHILYKKRIEERTSMIAYDPQLEWKNALKRAWYFIRFREWLASGIITFSFFKKDGSIREAKGTLHPLLIPADKAPKGSQTTVNCQFSTINYFDLDKQEWRSFNICNFIGFVSVYQLVYFSSKTAQKIDKSSLKERA